MLQYCKVHLPNDTLPSCKSNATKAWLGNQNNWIPLKSSSDCAFGLEAMRLLEEAQIKYTTILPFPFLDTLRNSNELNQNAASSKHRPFLSPKHMLTALNDVPYAQQFAAAVCTRAKFNMDDLEGVLSEHIIHDWRSSDSLTP